MMIIKEKKKHQSMYMYDVFFSTRAKETTTLKNI
jgi:hypothetical protein